MNAKISVFVICGEAIIYLLLCNLHDFTFNNNYFVEHRRTAASSFNIDAKSSLLGQ